MVVNLNTSSKDQTFKFNNDSIAHVKQYTTVSTKTSTGVKLVDFSIPQSFGWEQNYPNPFNSSTAISFSLPSKLYVLLKVFDMMGREVATLVNEKLDAGNHCRQRNASNSSSGVYFYRLVTSTGFVQTKKLVLLE